MTILLANATVASLSPRSVRKGHVLIDGERVVGVLDAIPEGDHTVVDVHGRLVMPGNVCGHTHLYSALARGMPAPTRNPRNFVEILELIWWRLDRALDEASIRASASIGAIDALKAGTTSLVDHHASPSCIDGSLDMMAEEMSRVGVRGVLCYEVTDRNGRDGREAGLRETDRFLRDGPSRFPLMRGLVGAHASFTLDDETLDALGGIAQQTGVGVHIHVAEDLADQEDAIQRTGSRVVHRLDAHGIVRPDSLLAHGVHVDDGEIDVIGRRKSWVAHNCRSNLNNSVGRAPVARLLETIPGRLVLGTDGIDEDMFAESRTAYFRARGDSLERYAEQFTDMLCRGAELVSASFSQSIGPLAAGAVADLVILEYDPPTPLTPENIAWHWMFGLTDGLVRDVMVGGKWVVRDGEMVNVDEERERSRAREEATKLWQRMESL